MQFDIYSAAVCFKTHQIDFPSQGQGDDHGSAATRDEQVDDERSRELEKELVKLACLECVDDQVRVLKEELELLRKRKLAGEAYTVAEASGILQLTGPCGVAVDGEGRLIVLDWERERMQLLDPDGMPLVSCALSASGIGGGYTEEEVRRGEVMLEPCEVVMDDSKKVAVVNSDYKAVVVYVLD